MKIMITGHRPERLVGREQEVKEWIKNKFDELGAGIADEAICGMAQGVDQIFAFAALETGIPLTCFYAYKRDKFHPVEEHINENADIIFLSDKFYKGCHLDRDEEMVDESDIVLAVWDGIPAGGTYYTIEYAKMVGKRIIYFPWISNQLFDDLKEGLSQAIELTKSNKTPPENNVLKNSEKPKNS